MARSHMDFHISVPVRCATKFAFLSSLGLRPSRLMNELHAVLKDDLDILALVGENPLAVFELKRQ